MPRETKSMRIEREIAALQKELSDHQRKCKHPNAIKTPKADTGNYDPSEDRYWYECRCPLCLKHWFEDQ
jgi:hypothetical protein